MHATGRRKSEAEVIAENMAISENGNIITVPAPSSGSYLHIPEDNIAPVPYSPVSTQSSENPGLNLHDVTSVQSQLQNALSAKARKGGHLHQPSIAIAHQEAINLTSSFERIRISNPGMSGDNNNNGNGSMPMEDDRRSSTSSSQGPTSPAKKRQSISYVAERVIGNGSFGVVYQATVIETGETVAIKKVLQDRRFKNRELQILSMVDHPVVVGLKHCFYSKGERPDEIYLNLVMEYIPDTIHRTIRNHTKANKLVPIMYTKVYIYQVARALSYIHFSGICHRDIKPQNLLLNPKTHECKLCDFGSAKILVKGEPNVSYICSRYYRAPELVFEATDYTSAIDVWSMGCVLAELLLGTPLFPGESGVDQLIEIIKILGSPSKEEIYAMNPHHTSFKFPSIKPHPWAKVLRNKAPTTAIDLVSKLLRYDPKTRLDPFECLSHPFFDELRDPNAKLPNGKPLPNIFNFTPNEIRVMQQKGLIERLLPPEIMKKYNIKLGSK